MLITGSTNRSSAGFSLVELMFTIVILAVLLSIAVPGFQGWLRNIQIRNAAESIVSGVQRARSAAVTRNTSTTFVLASDSAWTVNVVSPAATIESRPAAEGSQAVTRTVTPTDATTLTFNNLGVVVPNADASASLTQVDLAATGGNRNLRITIGVGGNAKMCDPNLATGSSPSAC